MRAKQDWYQGLVVYKIVISMEMSGRFSQILTSCFKIITNNQLEFALPLPIREQKVGWLGALINIWTTVSAENGWKDVLLRNPVIDSTSAKFVLPDQCHWRTALRLKTLKTEVQHLCFPSENQQSFDVAGNSLVVQEHSPFSLRSRLFYPENEKYIYLIRRFVV